MMVLKGGTVTLSCPGESQQRESEFSLASRRLSGLKSHVAHVVPSHRGLNNQDRAHLFANNGESSTFSADQACVCLFLA